jgi:hypothetical protein
MPKLAIYEEKDACTYLQLERIAYGGSDDAIRLNVVNDRGEIVKHVLDIDPTRGLILHEYVGEGYGFPVGSCGQIRLAA